MTLAATPWRSIKVSVVVFLVARFLVTLLDHGGEVNFTFLPSQPKTSKQRERWWRTHTFTKPMTSMISAFQVARISTPVVATRANKDFSFWTRHHRLSLTCCEKTRGSSKRMLSLSQGSHQQRALPAIPRMKNFDITNYTDISVWTYHFKIFRSEVDSEDWPLLHLHKWSWETVPWIHLQ